MRSLARWEWLVRALIRLYPISFRERFASDMLVTFREQARRAESTDGLYSMRRLIPATIGGLVRGLPEAHVRDWRLRASERRTAVLPPRTPMRSFLQDLHYALRALTKQRGLAIVASLTLALGIGANTAVFSVLNSVILTPLPYTAPDQLVRIYSGSNMQPDERQFLTAPDIVAARDETDAFSGVAISYTYRESGVDLMLDGVPERVRAMRVGADYFTTFGATPQLGRTFERSEERTGIARVILSHALWERLTNSSPDVIGTAINLNGESFEVIGVMRPTFRDVVAGDVSAWVPQDLVLQGSNTRNNNFLTAVARLAPGTTLAQAQAKLDLMMERQRDASGQAEEREWATLRAVPLRDDVVGESSMAVYVLMGAAGLVLLIACLNVANLFLARGVTQRREIAIRSALGAARSRLVGQRLAEALLVAIVGGAVGSVVAFGGVRVLLALSPTSLARSEEVGFDPVLLGFALALTLVTALLFGAAPAVSATRVDPADALHDGGRGSTGGRRGGRLRSVLVSSQVALALIILVGAVTLGRSFVDLQNTNLGFDPGQIATFEVNLPGARYAEPAARAQFHQRLIASLQTEPGIEAVAATSWLPGNGDYNEWGVRYRGTDGDVRGLPAQVRIVEGAYFEALRIPLLQGRLFESTDTFDGQRVALVSESYAMESFGTTDIEGMELGINGPPFRVIGVVADAAVDVTGRRARQVYLRHEQFADDRNWPLNYLVRATGDASSAIAQSRTALRTMDANLVMHHARTLDAVLGDHRARQRFTMVLMTAFALVAATLAAVGLYGVLAYLVTQRRREIGVRMALGAPTSQVRRLIVGHAAVLAGTGIAIGVAGALALGRVLESLVVGVSARDPLALGGVAAGLAVVSLAAAFVPTWRATRVDPLEALRGD
jgi:putative ABC transport system permease protein